MFQVNELKSTNIKSKQKNVQVAAELKQLSIHNWPGHEGYVL